jgi:hypothetical protein
MTHTEQARSELRLAGIELAEMQGRFFRDRCLGRQDKERLAQLQELVPMLRAEVERAFAEDPLERLWLLEAVAPGLPPGQTAPG